MSSDAPAASARWAKGALRRLAETRQEPTPANYARAYAEEAGAHEPAAAVLPPRARSLVMRLAQQATTDPDQREALAGALWGARMDDLQHALDAADQSARHQAQGLTTLIGQLARGLARGSRTWPIGRKKESLQRVLDGSGRDTARLMQRLGPLLAAWDGDADDPIAADGAHDDSGSTLDRDPGLLSAVGSLVASPAAGAAPPAGAADAGDPILPQLTLRLHGVISHALGTPSHPAASDVTLQAAWHALAPRLGRAGNDPDLLGRTDLLCLDAERWLSQRQRLLSELSDLNLALTDSLTELAEDDSWARGQVASLRERLAQVDSPRAVRAAADMLATTVLQQRGVKAQREQARDALKHMIGRMLIELAELDARSSGFGDRFAGYARTIASAGSLQELAGVVDEMVGSARAVQSLVGGTRDRLAEQQRQATELQQRVEALEGDLRRLSDEVSTDVLTQVANRRGLMQAFASEAAAATAGAPLAVALIDIDNFKRLNDTLGHAAGDVALKSLAGQVRQRLRPQDHVARFGGEEFVLLLPALDAATAQSAVGRLQRELSAALFLHEGREVFVTFSAGVTSWRPGEALEPALERADAALYEAKRTGKNRTCLA
ncbi:MAG: diguanylate cyclase domain-containing protein [Aquabacterium sp.]